MLVYILDPMTLEKIDVIEEYETCLWVERFIEAGECRIVVGATHKDAVRLRPGTMLLHQDSDEPMLIETRDVKEGKITAVAKTIEAFFNERWVGPLGRAGLPSNIIRYVVYNMQNRQGGRYAIGNLYVQDFVPDSGVIGRHEEHILGFEKGHDAVLRLAKKYSMGVAVKRDMANTGGLLFVVRDSNDRSQPGTDDYIKFSPKNDNFVAIGELYSLQDWVDVILVHAPKKFATNVDDPAYGWPPMSYPDHTAQGGPDDFQLGNDINSFDWRLVEITCDDIDQAYIDKRITDYWEPEQGFPASWFAMTFAQWQEIIRGEMRARAKDEWHKRQATQKVVFDGQVPGEILKYGRDYHLGDLVVVEGNFTGGTQTAMVSEYIRSSDGSGARSYPTLAPPLDAYDTEDPSGPGGGYTT